MADRVEGPTDRQDRLEAYLVHLSSIWINTTNDANI